MSPGARFKRALVALLLELARVYGLTTWFVNCLGTRPSKLHTTVNIVPRVFTMCLDMAIVHGKLKLIAHTIERASSPLEALKHLSLVRQAQGPTRSTNMQMCHLQSSARAGIGLGRVFRWKQSDGQSPKMFFEEPLPP